MNNHSPFPHCYLSLGLSLSLTSLASLAGAQAAPQPEPDPPDIAQESDPATSAQTVSDPGASAPTENRAGSEGTASEVAELDEPKAMPSPDPYNEAKERVQRAEKLYEEGNYDAALTEFQRAYDTMLGHPARSYVLYNVGRCQEKLYRYDDAIASYKKYLGEAGEDAEDRATVSAKIDLLEGLLGSLRVRVVGKKGPAPASYLLWVDGRRIGENVTQFSIPSGNHEVEIRATGFESELLEVQVAARQEKDITFEMSPLAKEYKGVRPTYFYVTGGLALASGVIGGAFGIMTLNTNSHIKNKEPALVSETDREKIQRQALLADIFLISAGVLATSTTILAFLTDWSAERPDSPPPSQVRFKEMGFSASPRGGFINVVGTF